MNPQSSHTSVSSEAHFNRSDGHEQRCRNLLVAPAPGDELYKFAPGSESNGNAGFWNSGTSRTASPSSIASTCLCPGRGARLFEKRLRPQQCVRGVLLPAGSRQPFGVTKKCPGPLEQGIVLLPRIQGLNQEVQGVVPPSVTKARERGRAMNSHRDFRPADRYSILVRARAASRR